MSATQTHAQLLAHLARLRRRALLLLAGEALALALALGLILGLVTLGLEAWFYVPPPWRVVLGLAVVVVPCLVLGLVLGRGLPACLSLKALCLRVEARCPQLQQQLISTLELWEDPAQPSSTRLRCCRPPWSGPPGSWPRWSRPR